MIRISNNQFKYGVQKKEAILPDQETINFGAIKTKVLWFVFVIYSIACISVGALIYSALQ